MRVAPVPPDLGRGRAAPARRHSRVASVERRPGVEGGPDSIRERAPASAATGALAAAASNLPPGDAGEPRAAHRAVWFPSAGTTRARSTTNGATAAAISTVDQ